MENKKCSLWFNNGFLLIHLYWFIPINKKYWNRGISIGIEISVLYLVSDEIK